MLMVEAISVATYLISQPMNMSDLRRNLHGVNGLRRVLRGGQCCQACTYRACARNARVRVTPRLKLKQPFNTKL